MRAWRGLLPGVAALALCGCGRPAPPPEHTGAPPDQEPPVAVDPDSPIQYPPKLYDQSVEGDVVLRMFVDSTGRLIAESSKVAESSGYPALDSAALAGAKGLHFAPARRHGLPVATTFLQPIEFRHPGDGSGVGGGGARTVKARPDTSRTKRQIVRPVPPPDTTLPKADTGTAPRDTSRTRPDTSSMRRDTSPARPDTSSMRRDTSRAAADTHAVPH